MVNKNYIKGKNKEQRIANRLKKEGFIIAQRSAGSHSPIDVFAIHKEKKIIKFIQSKPKKFSRKQKQKLLEEHGWLSDKFQCEFTVE